MVIRLAGSLWALLCPLLVTADTVFLKTGGTLEGKAELLSDGSVRLTLQGGGSVTLSADQVQNVHFGPTARERFEERKKRLAPDDAEGHYRLALWCREEGLKEQAEEMFRCVLSLNPEHRGAREALGWRRDGGKWVTEEEYHRKRGEVFFEGRWRPRAERDRILKKRQAQKRLSALKQLIRRAAGRTESAQRAREELRSYPAGEVVPALLASLTGRVRTRVFAAGELVRYPLRGPTKVAAVRALVKQVITGSTGQLRRACCDALRKINWKETVLFFCPYLFSSSPRYRIYALQALLYFPDLRAVQYVIRSFPLALGNSPSSGSSSIMTGVSAGYLRGYELIPAGATPGGSVIVLPRIGRITLGTSLGASEQEDPETKRRKAELYLRFRLLEVLTGKSFGTSAQAWLRWYRREGRDMIHARLKASSARKKAEKEELAPRKKEAEKPPPSLPD